MHERAHRFKHLPSFCGEFLGSGLSGQIPNASPLMSTPPSLLDCGLNGLTSRRTRPILIDAFPLSYETNTLLLRFLELGDTVDAFVIIESDTTHSGTPRNLTFPVLAQCLERWRGKLFHSVLRANSLPLQFNVLSANERAWAIENLQRNNIAAVAAIAAKEIKLSGRASLSSEIFVAVSDLDEIPRPEAYSAVVSCEGLSEPVALTLDSFFYYDYRWRKKKAWQLGPRIFRFDESNKTFFGGKVPQDARSLEATPMSKEDIFVKGGWHSSYFLGYEGIQRKIKSIAHTEIDLPRFTNLTWITESVNNGKDLFGRGEKESVFEMDCRSVVADIPQAAKNNPQLLNLFCPDTKR